MRNPGVLIAALPLLLCGCGSLLPSGSSDTPAPFETYAQAKAAVERIVPLRTRTADLPALGFDHESGRNVVRIPYPEIVGRLAPHPGVPLAELDPGIRECIVAQGRCEAYLFRFERHDRKREGGFWADFLNIRRVTHVTGWWFETLVVTSEGKVLFRNYAGEQRIERTEKQTNPLGPLQQAGESAGGLLIR